MTKAVFLTLQRGDHIFCWRLSLPALVSAGACLLCAALFLFIPETPDDPQTFQQAKRRIAGLQAELERVSAEQALTSQLLERRMAEALKRLANLEGQAQTLAEISPARPAALRLRHLEEAMTRTERSQMREIDGIIQSRHADLARIDAALAEAGISLAAQSDTDPSAGTGGPFIPLEQATSGPFADKLAQAAPLIARLAAFEAQVPNLPLRAPFAGRIEVSSGYGARSDPFHGRAAWHSGIDLRNDSGSDVLATGAGTISAAGWNGAYGLTIDIDHGNGLSTRYAHLSRLLVREGDLVAPHQIIALSGASGRTKGAHLHYEWRAGGETLDPRRLLKAGEKLGLLHKPSSRPREDAQ